MELSILMELSIGIKYFQFLLNSILNSMELRNFLVKLLELRKFVTNT